MKYQLLIIFLLGISLGTAGAWAGAADISGTWVFSVQVGSHEPDNHTFVFKQEGEKLTGSTQSSLFGELKVTGTVKGDKVALSIEAKTSKGHPFKATYTGTIVSPTKMSGDVEYNTAPPGKWTATKKK